MVTADAGLCRLLRADLEASGFTVDGVAALLGPVADRALHRESPLPAVRATDHSTEPAAVLARLWVLGRDVLRGALDAALPGTGTAGAERLGLVMSSGAAPDDEVVPLVDLRPYAADDTSWWLASDVGELATGTPLREDHVLGVGGASVTLAGWTPRTPVARALDVGTGCGVQALHLARHASSVVATDVSARCLAYAQLNAAVAGVRLDLRRGSLLRPVDGERFDLVVSNPPFVITPRSADLPTYGYRDAGLPGDALTRHLVGGLADVLAAGGVGQLLANWEHHAGQGWDERVGDWLPPDLDAWVVQREVQDPAEYAETWARDGGHRPGDPAHTAMVGAWLDDFAARGVVGVGFGVVTVRRPSGGGVRMRRFDDLPTPLTGPMGPVVTDVLAAHDWLSAHGADLLDQHLVVAADVTEERHHRPGDEDPLIVLLRQGGGLQRSVRADTALAGVVGACDGELPLGSLVGALAELLDEPVGTLSERLLPAVRTLVADGLLRPAD